MIWLLMLDRKFHIFAIDHRSFPDLRQYHVQHPAFPAGDCKSLKEHDKNLQVAVICSIQSKLDEFPQKDVEN